MADEKITVYYADGYHGGLKGHMPFGCWPDILHVFREKKEWKISIEIEPISWDHIKYNDPETYYALQNEFFAKENQDRVEIVAGSYAQPYCWNISGESIIRQLLYGIRLNKLHFPDSVIDSYAVQEPCWSSSLPQILRSLGFKRSVLKNPGTAWAGYSRGNKNEIVNWVGPDGTSIPCVPRYECEGIVGTWATECERMEPDFVQKCAANGIKKPVGSQYQDLGWNAGLNLGTGYATYIIWREYFEKIAEKPAADWHFSQEDILCTLPWGEKHLQRLTRQVRSAENKIITAEKLASMAFIMVPSAYPEERFMQSWNNLMLAQHHDAWICAKSREDRKNWSWVGGAQTWLVEENCDDIIRKSLYLMRGESESGHPRTRFIKIHNTLGFERKEKVYMEIPMMDKCSSLILKDSSGTPVDFQMAVVRTGDYGIINAVSLVFEACVPGMGFNTYTVEYLDEAPAANVLLNETSAVFKDESTLLLNTDIYEITLDLNRGGIITRLFHKQLQKDFCTNDGPYYFNEYRGYFVKQGKDMSSTEVKASAKIVENGPIRLVVEIQGGIADNRLTTTITLVKGQEAIDIKTRADFNGEQWIGDPCEIDDDKRESERVRSYHDSFRKLHAVFPLNSRERRIYKNAAFDVCRSVQEDTRFTSWDQIKHNILLNWIDIHDESDDTGVAIFCDHTNSYGHSPDYPVHLTFAWSGSAGYWWGKCPMWGHQEMRYALVPHRGNWEEALISQHSAAWNEPLLSHMTLHETKQPSVSLFEVLDPHVEIASVYMEDDKVLLRLFNSGTGKTEFVLKLGFNAAKIEMVELDGRLAMDMQSITGQDGRGELKMEMPPFGIRTLSFSQPYGPAGI